MITRIAPTPSGFLHEGNIFSFLLTRALADKFNGRIILRIDDLDGERCRKEYLDDIFACLSLLDIRYDAGPANTADFLTNHSQQLKLEYYNKWLETLKTTGLVYACSCSRKKINELSVSGQIRCACRMKHLPLNTAGTALRIFVPAETGITINDELSGRQVIKLSSLMGDFVICRRDGKPAYQLTSVIDDVDAGVNYIVRGEDLLPSTAAQLYLASLLQLPSFSQSKFLHHPLLRDPDGVKLSKSAGSLSIKSRMETGINPREISANLDSRVKQVISAII